MLISYGDFRDALSPNDEFAGFIDRKEIIRPLVVSELTANGIDHVAGCHLVTVKVCLTLLAEQLTHSDATNEICWKRTTSLAIRAPLGCIEFVHSNYQIVK